MNWDNFHAMSSTIYWICIILLFVQPFMKYRMTKNSRQIAFRELQQRRKSKVIALIHRREMVNFLGLPLMQFLDIKDSEEVLRAIRATPASTPIDLIVHTPAGLSLAAEQIARALVKHKGRVTAFIPHYAMSGGALLAISANEIVMCPDAILGALDPTVGQYPAASVLAVTQRKTPDQMTDATFLLVEQAKKAVSQMQALVTALLSKRIDPAQAEQLATTLTSGRWTQDYPISVEELKELGLPVSTDMPEDVLCLMNLFPQGGRQRPSVDYIPAPYTLPAPSKTAPHPGGS